VSRIRRRTGQKRGDAEESTTKDGGHDHDHQAANIQCIGEGDGKSKSKGGFQDNCNVFVCVADCRE
jgi:hypothetical protein